MSNLPGPTSYAPQPLDPYQQMLADKGYGRDPSALGTDQYGNVVPQYGGFNGGANAVANSLSQQGSAYGSAPNQNDPNLMGDQGVASAWQKAQAARGQQVDAVAGERAAALGQGPSAAAAQQNVDLGSSLANSYAAGRLGGSPSSGMRSEQAANSGAIGTGVQGRAGEITNASGNYAGAAGGLAQSGVAGLNSANGYALQSAADQQQAAKNKADLDLYYQQQANQTEENQLQSSTAIWNAQHGNAAQLGTQNYTLGQQFNQNLAGAGLGAASGLATSMYNQYGNPGSGS